MDNRLLGNSVELFVPPSHSQCSLENFDWKGYQKIKELVDSVLEGKEGRGFVLFGDPGIGKTHLLVGLFRKFVEQGKIIGSEVMFYVWSDLVNEIVMVMQEKVIPEVVMDRLVLPEILIIDDIRPSWGRVWNDLLKRFIEKSYDRKGRIFLSTNAESVDDLVQRWQLEDYWLSRLKDLVIFVKMKGKDRRGNV